MSCGAIEYVVLLLISVESKGPDSLFFCFFVLNVALHMEF